MGGASVDEPNGVPTRSGSIGVGMCPACGSYDVEPIAELRGVPAQVNDVWASFDDATATPRGDLVLAFCGSCALTWNAAFNESVLEYSAEYENSLHFSPTFQRYAEGLARSLVSRYDLRGKTVVEVGSGKGEFLSLLCSLGVGKGIGFDPSYDGEVDDRAGGSIRIVRDLYTDAYADLGADFVLSRHVLEHTADPAALLRSIRGALSGREDAAIYFEVPAGEYVLREADVWELIYAHVTIFTEPALRSLLARIGFRVNDAGFSFGGQFLWVEATPTEGADETGIDTDRVHELKEEARDFGAVIDEKRALWATRLREWRAGDVALWGAGARGVTFLNVVEGGNRIGAVVDVNPRKRGKRIPGTGQRVISPDDLAARPPDRVLVPNPVYLEEIEAMLRDRGLNPEIVVV